jgi:uncharacterized protein (TIGR00251 family)
VVERLKIPVLVNPKSSKRGIAGVVEGRLQIRTTAPPTNARANPDVARQLAAAFGVAPSRMSLGSGAKSRIKTFEVSGPVKRPEWLSALGGRRPMGG